jgi:hypothetical protein
MSTPQQKYADLKKTLEKEGERGVKELQKQKGIINTPAKRRRYF